MADERFRFVKIDADDDEEVEVIRPEGPVFQPEPLPGPVPEVISGDAPHNPAEFQTQVEVEPEISVTVSPEEQVPEAVPNEFEDQQEEEDEVPFAGMQRGILVFLALLVIVFVVYCVITYC